MQGRRVYNPIGGGLLCNHLERGDYGLVRGGFWGFRSPEGTVYVFRRGDPAVHEHEDGTVTLADRLVRGEWTPIEKLVRGK